MPMRDATGSCRAPPSVPPLRIEYGLARRLADGVYLLVQISEEDVDESTRTKFCTKTQDAACRIATPEQLFVFARATARQADGRRRPRGSDGGTHIGISTSALRASVNRAEPTSSDIAKLVRGIRAGERAVIARAITLVESRRADHQRAAHRLVQELMPFTGGAVRLGITGTPGVGKSTTIDALGSFLTGEGR